MSGRGITSLRAQIMRLRVLVDSEARHFIPEDSLRGLMTKEVVHKAVCACHDIKRYQVEEVVDVILRSALKVFAILVLLKGEEGLILRFVENDGFQKTAMDARLPLHPAQLEALMPEDAMEDFIEKQWEFVVPFFSKAIIHRVMAASTRMPFIMDQDTGKDGGFGRIYEIQIHPEYHVYPVTANDRRHLRLVRKEFLPNSSDEGSFKQEAHNLNILNQIRHPNIIEMFGSYTYRGKHNAIFPLATDGDLAALFLSDTRPVEFANDFAIYAALGDLSAAIEVVHNYTANDIDLELIGIHHDLKPQNILVHNGTFLLADFGLTTFKSADKTSKSLYRIGGGHYLAPECEDYENGFAKMIVGRSSDIWSFGCILAEVATYMRLGAEGVAAFRTARKVQIGGFTTYTFHAGINTPNLGVLEWLHNLDLNQEAQEIPLIEMMLKVDPAARPTAGQVTMGLRFMTVISYAHHLQAQFKSMSVIYASHELETQERLFEAWITSMLDFHGRGLSTLSAPGQSDGREFHMYSESLQEMRRLLEDMRKELSLIGLRYSKATSPLFHDLRRHVEGLVNTLPSDLRNQVYSEFELWMAQHDDTILDPEHEAFAHVLNVARSRKLTMLATMRRLNQMTLSPSSNQELPFHLPMSAVKITGRFEDHMVGVLTRPESPRGINVLIERVEYDMHWVGTVSEELLDRMTAIAELLRSLAEPGRLPILPCQGFYHMPQRFAFAFVFEMPPRARYVDYPLGESLTAAWSLSMVIEKTSRNAGPLLNDRFHLAYLLAATLLDFHKAGWLHKSISPYNVVLLTTKETSGSHMLRLPYLIGFNRSRQNLPTAFTEGPNDTDKSLFHSHPQYLKDKCRFSASFDYYSLGLVLLEIGLWTSLHQLLMDCEIFPPKMSESGLTEVLNRVVPSLKHTMGIDYYEAVCVCLLWDRTAKKPDLAEMSNTEQLLRFELLVVDPIRKCSLSEELTDEQRFPSSVNDKRPQQHDNSLTASGSSSISARAKLPVTDLPAPRQTKQKVADDPTVQLKATQTSTNLSPNRPSGHILASDPRVPQARAKPITQHMPSTGISPDENMLPVVPMQSRDKVLHPPPGAQIMDAGQQELKAINGPPASVDESIKQSGYAATKACTEPQESPIKQSGHPATKTPVKPQKKYQTYTAEEWYAFFKSRGSGDNIARLQVDDIIYREEHHLGLRGFDDPDPVHEQTREKEEPWKPRLRRTWIVKPSKEEEQEQEEEEEEKIHKDNPLGLFDGMGTPVIGPPPARLEEQEADDLDRGSSLDQDPSNSKNLWS